MNSDLIIGIVVLVIGWAVLAVWLILFAKSGKHKELFETLSEKEYPLHELYGTGFALMEALHYGYKSSRDRKLRNEISVLFGEKYTEYYLRVTYAQAATYAMLMFIVTFILYGLSQEIVMLPIGLLLTVVLAYYALTSANKKIKKRSDALLLEFSEVTSQLALLTNAGMILHEAWQEIAYSAEGELYSEMRLSIDDMNSGISEVEAIRRFGMRCMIPEAKKFATTLIQGMEKGNKELSAMITTQSDEMWTTKQQLARQAGEKANSKLLLPMFIMFAGILIMIVVPIFTNLGV